MTKLLLIRHGQSEWNALGRWQGQADPPLSDRGREEARLAASKLTAFPGVIVSSPLLRARETAEIIAAELGGRPVSIEPQMQEIDVGEFSGLTNDEIEAKLPDAWRLLLAGELERFPSGETRADFRDRVIAALQALAERHPSTEILVATHGGAIGAIERHLDVHPGVGVRNLEGRWFEVDDGQVRAASDRVALIDQES